MSGLILCEELQASITKTNGYFSDWDETSAVRVKKNTYKIDAAYLEQNLNHKNWFSPKEIVLFSHPLLSNLTPDQQQKIMGYLTLQFLEFIAHMEHEYVNIILGEFIFGACPYILPEEMRLDALKIYTDEAYHALFSVEATKYIREFLGLCDRENLELFRNSRLEGLKKIVDLAPKEDNFLVRFGIAVVSETVGVKEIVEKIRHVAIEPLVNLISDHAQDEMKHCLFFSVLFEVVWAQLTEAEKIKLGCYFSIILKQYLDKNIYAIQTALFMVELGKDLIEKVLYARDSLPFYVRRAEQAGGTIFRLFNKVKMFDIPEVRQSFIDEGFPKEILL